MVREKKQKLWNGVEVPPNPRTDSPKDVKSLDEAFAIWTSKGQNI